MVRDVVPVGVHLLGVWVVWSVCAVVTLQWGSSSDGLGNLDIAVGLLAVFLLLGVVGASSRAVVPVARSLPGLALWTLGVTVLGVIGAVVATTVVLLVRDDAGDLRVSALVGLPCVVVSAFAVSMREMLRVLVAGVVTAAGLALVFL